MVEDSVAENDERHWYALRTKSRQEKVAEKILSGRGVETFLPLRRVVSRWSDRKKEVHFPLFPGYLFLKADRDQLKIVSNTKGVLHVVRHGGSPVPIPEGQIESVRKVLESGVAYDPCPYVKEGTEVEVTRGPLKGCYGRVIKRKGKDYLIVSIDIISRSVTTHICAQYVKPFF